MISLKEICINTIVEEFERFFFTFKVSKDETLTRYSKFLQKTYISEIISGLSEKEKLQDEYLDFLFNIHLKYFNEEWLQESRYRNSIQDIIWRLPNLTKIDLYEKCSDEILEKITEFCHQVVEINAFDSFITDAGLKCLCKNENGKAACPNLRVITICFCSHVTDQGVEYLIQNLPSLEKIDYGNVPGILYSLHKEDLHNLKELPSYNLVYLDMLPQKKFTYYPDLLKTCLAVCPRLKSIKCNILEEEQLSLFNHANLGMVNLHILESNPKIDINTFLKMNGYNLVYLKVSNCIISVNTLSASCPKLERLDIDNVAFSDDDCDSQLAFDCLIDCEFCSIKDDNAIHIAISLLLPNSPKLNQIRFRSCNLSSVTTFWANNHLKDVSFVSSRIEVNFFKNFLLCSPFLKDLLLDNCDLSSNEKLELTEFAETLTNKPKIHVWDFRSMMNYFSSPECQEFVNAIAIQED